MLKITKGQMQQFGGEQRSKTLHRICEHFATNDPALARGRSSRGLLPFVEKAAKEAQRLGLESVGSISCITMILLAIDGDPTAEEGLAPLMERLSDRTKPETVRLEEVNHLLMDLDASLPPHLRRDQVTLESTPELDV